MINRVSLHTFCERLKSSDLFKDSFWALAGSALGKGLSLLAGIAVLMLVARNNKPASELTSPESGITVEVYTNEPGIQVYTDNFLPVQTYNSECIFKFSVEK